MTVNYILLCITVISLVFGFSFLFLALRYLYMYRNLKANFKSFLNFVDTKYILKNDVILYNATIEALTRAREKHNAFEIKVYSKLLERLKEED